MNQKKMALLMVIPLIALTIFVSAQPATPEDAKGRMIFIEKYCLPDLVLLNGKVVTVDEGFTIAEAIAIKDGKIVAVGATKDVRKLIGGDTEVIDLMGKTVVPGFEDSHNHFISTAHTLYGFVHLFPEDTPNMDVFLAKVADWVSKVGPGEWVLGMGWDQDKMEWTGEWDRPYKWPTRWDLDEVAPDNPVLLYRICWHAAVANSKALEIAGITKDTPQPEGGEIVMDPETGEPTGVLKEAAVWLVEMHIPSEAYETTYEELLDMFQEALRVGLTCVEEPGIGGGRIALYERAYKEGKLPIRVNFLISSEYLDHLVALGISSPFGNEWLKICGVKFMADGSLGARTAALREPYSDEPETKGILRLSLEEAVEVYTKAHKFGLQCCTHAIGDLANEVVLKANRLSYEAVGEECGTYRDRIEHCQILGPDIIEEYKAQDMIASIQFSFAVSDGPWAEKRVGPERIKYSYCWRKLLEAGVRLCGGTDSDVETYVPLEGIQKIVTSKNLDGTPEEGFFPEEVLTVEEAIKLYTIWSAYGMWQEDYLGSIEVGKLADLVVLSGDILSVPHEKIHQLEVVYTIVDGNIVYARE